MKNFNLFKSIFLILTITISLQTVMAQELTLTNEYGVGNYFDVALSGQYAYLASGYGGVTEVNINNPSSPFITSTILPDLPDDFSRSYIAQLSTSHDKNTLYCADNGYGLAIINISTKMFPSVTSVLDLPSDSTDVACESIYNHYVYLVDVFNLYVVDVLDKSNPQLILSKEIDIQPVNISIQGSLMVLAGQEGAAIYSLSNPSNPSQLYSSYNKGTCIETSTGDAILNDNYLYLINSQQIQILDVSSPTNPETVYFEDDIDYAGPSSVCFNENTAYLAEADLSIIDMSNIENPVELGWLETEENSIRVQYSNNHVFIAGDGGLDIVNVQNTSNPVLAGSLTRTGEPYEITGANNVSYIASNSGLTIIENNNDTLSILGEFSRETDADENQVYKDIAVDNSYAYCLGSDGLDNGLEILNISNPSNITLTSFTIVDELLNCLFKNGDYIYLGGENGVSVINASNPLSPSYLKSVASSSFNTDEVLDITGKENYIYLAQSSKISVLNITNPSSITLEKAITTTNEVKDLWVDSNTLFAMTGSGLKIYDIENGSNPSLISTYPIYTQSPLQVCTQGDLAILSVLENQIYVLDISNISNPDLIQTVETEGAATCLTNIGNYINAGLQTSKILWYKNSSETSCENTAYLPHITSTDTWSTFLIADNISDNESSMTVTLYSNGSLVSETSYNIQAGEQRIIELNVEGCGKVQYNSDEICLKETFKSSAQGIAEFVISDFAQTTSYYLLPQYNADNLTWSGLALMNPNSSSTQITATAHSSSGSVLGTATGTVNGNNKLVGMISQFFPGVDFEDVARVKVISTLPLTGITISGYENERLLFSKGEGTGYTGNLPITHIAGEINEWNNFIIMDNVGNSSENVSITFYKNGEMADELNYTLNAYSTKFINLSNLYTISTIPECGIVSVESDKVFVRESFIFISANGGTAEFVLTNEKSDKAIYNFPNYFQTDMDWMGLSVFNTSSINKQITAKAYANSEVIATETVTVNAYSRYVNVLEGLFSEVSFNEVERVVVTGDANFAGINISGNGHERLLFTPALSKGTVHEDDNGNPTTEFIDTIHHISHSGLWVEYNGMNIFIDPVNIQGTPSHKADIIFITHPYEDHLDIESISKIIKLDTTIVTVSAGLGYLNSFPNTITTVSPGNNYTVKGIPFSTIKAYNGTFSGGSHFQALGFVGYFIQLGENSIYHAGDTDHIPEMTGLNPTVALLPVGGAPEVMNPSAAADAALDINPEIAIPIHYDLYGSINDANTFASLLTGQIEVQILPNEQP